MQQKVKAIKESTYEGKTYWWVELGDGKRLMEVVAPAYEEGSVVNFEPTLWIFHDKGKGKSYYRRKQAEEVGATHAAQGQPGGDDRSKSIERQCGMKILGRLWAAGKIDENGEMLKRLQAWLREVTQ